MEQPKKESNPSSKSQKQNQLNSYVRYSGLAFQMMAAIGLAVWGGMKLDAWLGMRFPVFLVVLTLMSVAATLIITIKSLPKD
ncbi:AtpZ/AtpI family protein [Cesiribacter andamanensis]|uniref:Putative F0F1-ATPase subunit n=1 Tax=Cesiribacter andamanensis AMV16 TaxID=1279009 RepID=M7NJ80_9BACT|nr:AtpZ/AtpI family protein [Cesiribacter andamanensis]EMR01820.1 Putative F0F1-ATPase subunit [Cesiribacter andamanensis AMV16]